ncbi:MULTISPECIES: hypothetical protein [Actinoallomurus]|uniref:hypothetical protein n=1 Tax=Actinoallomurus TaxID=667113 RepID=UPI002093F581|nr:MULTISPECIES: hypothetical protein [Actinoallomurus]MCO5969913.1 hypothetical protein [Actinoallomurus soli]MCO5998319.1 hypothetical protein [Actinoallomurus rhizosphaericola]
MSSARLGVAVGVILLLVIGSAAGWYVYRIVKPGPGCTVTAVSGTGSGDYTLTTTQADNAATIAGVGLRMGVPDHAVSVAIATALQESQLVNLSSGDRDSAGLFQQRPSEGWGTYSQVVDPVHASTAFYEHLRQQPGWMTISITQAAQRVQHSATPEAYAKWEPEARAVASALTGERAAALSCHNLAITTATATLRSTALAELGTPSISGSDGPARGWAFSSWLVAHAVRLGVKQVTFGGETWTASSGKWSPASAAKDILSLRTVADPRS